MSTTLISAELGISPGNLYYHYPAKEELITKLFDRYDAALTELLRAADDVADVEDAWLLFHMLFELIWSYRFLYRDLNDLLSNNRKLENHFPFVLQRKARAVQTVIDSLAAGSGLAARRRARPRRSRPRWWSCSRTGSAESTCATRGGRSSPKHASAALSRGAFHVLCLLLPALPRRSRSASTCTRWRARFTTTFTRRVTMAKWTAFPHDARPLRRRSRRP